MFGDYRRRIAPLQERSCGAWEYTGHNDPMRTHVGERWDWGEEDAKTVIRRVLGLDTIKQTLIPDGILPLCSDRDRESILAVMSAVGAASVVVATARVAAARPQAAAGPAAPAGASAPGRPVRAMDPGGTRPATRKGSGRRSNLGCLLPRVEGAPSERRTDHRRATNAPPRARLDGRSGSGR